MKGEGRTVRDCGDLDIRIAADGMWYHQGTPIRRLPLVKLFASVLHKDEDGAYWLVTPVERGRVTVEDAPFLAVEMTVEGEAQRQVLSFRTNLDEIVAADRDHPLRVVNHPSTGEPRPYILIRNGLEARLTRAVFYQLVEIAREERIAGAVQYGVWSNNVFFPLGRMDES